MMKKQSMIPVVVAFTPNYFVPVSTCLYSIFDSSDKEDCYHIICLLSEELPERMKQKIQLIGAGRARYSFVNLQGRLNDIYIDEKFTVAALYRLLIPELLPDYDKVLYIDCDVIVRNNLAELYRRVDLRDNYLAGVFEAPMDFQVEYIESIGCHSYAYINSGFLIMNLHLLRKDQLVKRFIETAKGHFVFLDQDILNICCKDRILGLPPHYNSIRTFYLPQYRTFFFQMYIEQEWSAVQQHGTVHYTGTKPWNSFTIEFRVWWQYYERLPQAIKEEWTVNRKMYRIYRFYKTSLGTFLIETAQRLYRKMKY